MAIAQALRRAHDAGIIHRDLKPDNVFLAEGEEGRLRIKLVDLGIAKLVNDSLRITEAKRARITKSGAAIGTPHYMSPEQAQGLDTLDARTDIYSLGALFYELLTGEAMVPDLPSYEQSIVHLILHAAPPVSSKLPGVDSDLELLVRDMVAHDPAARPAWLTLGGAYETLGEREHAASAYRHCAASTRGPAAAECTALLRR